MFLCASCATKSYPPSNAIEELGERVIKSKEGLDIKLTPISEEKQNERKNLQTRQRRRPKKSWVEWASQKNDASCGKSIALCL